LALTRRIKLTPKEFKIPKLIQNLLKEYKDIISKESYDIERISVITYKINLVHPFPITAKQKTFDLIIQRKIKEEIKKLLDQEVIRPNNSSYSIGILLVTKKNGSIRVCIAFIGLNKATINDAYPLPNIWALLNAVREGCEWPTSMDMASRFWQIEINEEDKYKITHSILRKLYKYNVMLFGLKEAQ